MDISMEKNFPWQYRWISSRGKDSNMFFPVSDGSIKFVSTFEYIHDFSKIGEGKSHCLVTNSGGRIVTKRGSLPFLRGPTRLRKLREISKSPKRHWISVPWSFSFAVFDPKTKENFEGETLCRAHTSVIPSDSRIRKTSDSRIFFGVSSEHTKWPNNDVSLIWAECDSSRDLYQTPLVRELFKPAEFGSRFSSGVSLQSSSKRRIKLNILSLNSMTD